MSETNDQFISFEQLDTIRNEIDRLNPGYAIQELDPLHALDTGQGNCFTSAMIAGCAIALEFDFDVSVVWSSRLHATERPEGMRRTAVEGKTTDLNIVHIGLVAPRSSNPYDILDLSYGQNTPQTAGYAVRDDGGKITNYNFDDVDPRYSDVSKSIHSVDEAIVQANPSGEITVTPKGLSEGMTACDWQSGGEEYLAALNIPPIDYEALEDKLSCFLQALRDGNQIMPINPALS